MKGVLLFFLVVAVVGSLLYDGLVEPSEPTTPRSTATRQAPSEAPTAQYPIYTLPAENSLETLEQRRRDARQRDLDRQYWQYQWSQQYRNYEPNEWER